MTPKPIDGIQGKNVKLYILIINYEHVSLLFSLLILDYFIPILMHLKILKGVSKLSQNLTWTWTVLV